jgi:hypothetical protein
MPTISLYRWLVKVWRFVLPRNCPSAWRRAAPYKAGRYIREIADAIGNLAF